MYNVKLIRLRNELIAKIENGFDIVSLTGTSFNFEHKAISACLVDTHFGPRILIVLDHGEMIDYSMITLSLGV